MVEIPADHSAEISSTSTGEFEDTQLMHGTEEFSLLQETSAEYVTVASQPNESFTRESAALMPDTFICDAPRDTSRSVNHEMDFIVMEL